MKERQAEARKTNIMSLRGTKYQNKQPLGFVPLVSHKIP